MKTKDQLNKQTNTTNETTSKHTNIATTKHKQSKQNNKTNTTNKDKQSTKQARTNKNKPATENN